LCFIYSSLSVPAVQWGKQNESAALREYENQMGVTVTATGLSLHQELPYLGATADGIVCDNTILEIKCPYSGRDKTIQQLIQSGYPRLCNQADGTVVLKNNSPYYCQVQGEMAIKQCNMCHFVVWTPNDFIKLDVKFDSNFWHKMMLPKLKEFYTTQVLPKYISEQ